MTRFLLVVTFIASIASAASILGAGAAEDLGGRAAAVDAAVSSAVN